MITDGEPTAHFEDGQVEFSYPPTRRTIQETLREVQRCTSDGITINTFMLERSRALAEFVALITRINRGRAFYADARSGSASTSSSTSSRAERSGCRRPRSLGRAPSRPIGAARLATDAHGPASGCSRILLFLHVLGAIVAFGPTFAFRSSGGWAARSRSTRNFATRVSARDRGQLVYPLGDLPGHHRRRC